MSLLVFAKIEEVLVEFNRFSIKIIFCCLSYLYRLHLITRLNILKTCCFMEKMLFYLQFFTLK